MGSPDPNGQLESVEVLTPGGRGAVAVLRIRMNSEARLQQVIDKFFVSQSGMDLFQLPLARIVYGRWGAEDLVLSRTDPAVCEIHCHGGSAAVAAILTDLRQTGLAKHEAQPASLEQLRACISEWQDSGHDRTLRNLVEQEVQGLLLHAPTRRTARHLLGQLNGVLTEHLKRIVRHPGADARQKQATTILKWEAFARHLVVPWKVLILGRPNVGKSSLINALAGYQRSIVFDQPGTTRDLIDVRLILDEWPFEFVDSAGVRTDAEHPIETIGIRRTLDAAESCDACLVLEEASLWPDKSDFRRLVDHVGTGNIALVLTKSDLQHSDHPAQRETAEMHKPFSTVLSTSALNNVGLDSVRQWIVQTLIPQEPTPGTALPIPGCILEFLQQPA